MLQGILNYTALSTTELKRTLLSFFALLSLLISYYLVKPLRNSQFLNSFDPDLLPFVFLGIAFVSLMVTKFYGAFYGKVKKRSLIKGAYLIIFLLHLLFHFLLHSDNKPVVALFYVFASVYFLLALALMWACINDAFLPQEGQKCYGYVTAGATIGSLAGAELSSWVVTSAYRDQSLLIAGGLLLFSMFLVLKILPDKKSAPKPQPLTIQPVKPKAQHFFSDFVRLFQDRYIRGITMMVYSLALFNTVMEFQMSVQIDTSLSQKLYAEVFVDVKEKLGPEGFEKVHALKAVKSSQRSEKILMLAKQAEISETEFLNLYQNYLDIKEPKVRKFYIDIFRGQGYLGVILLLVTSRWLFTHMGLSFSVMLLPVFCLSAIVIMSFPVEIIIIQFLMILGGSMNYSLNNATKELLYTQTDEQTKFQLKPIVEGPIMRFGDVSASLLKLFIWFGMASVFGWSEITNQTILFAIVFVMIIIWVISVSHGARDFDAKRKQDRELASRPRI
ncbi:MAG: hypothetical protein H3C47_11070 [Candidatus Cloacimonetes bacterium]|nr:hypothetical protein [Candidatus Cloacimonadota bacterium]